MPTFQKIRDAFSPKDKERFLIVTVSAHENEAMLFSFGEEKKLVLQRIWRAPTLEKLFPKYALPVAHAHTILALHPELSFTATIPASQVREDKNVPVTFSEVDNFVGQAIGKVFTEVRKDASHALTTQEFDAILIDSRIVRCAVDNKELLDPAGALGRTLHVAIELTFTARPTYERVRFLFDREKFFFTETGKASLHVLQRFSSSPVGVLLLDAPQSFLLGYHAPKPFFAMHYGAIPWADTSFLETIAIRWGVPPVAQYELYDSYIRKELSLPILEELETAFLARAKGLFHAVRTSRLQGKIYVLSRTLFPFALPRKEGKCTFVAPSLRHVCEDLGFRVEPFEWRMEEGELFVRLAPFFDFYYDKSESALGRGLRRRLHWLGALSLRE